MSPGSELWEVTVPIAQLYVPTDQVAATAHALNATHRTRHIMRLGQAIDSRLELISAEVDAQGVDEVIAALQAAGHDPGAITIHQLRTVQPVGVRRGELA